MLRLAEAFGAEQSIEFDAGDLADLMLEDTDFLLLFDLIGKKPQSEIMMP